MNNSHDSAIEGNYPHGRGYGHDYMRGGEVMGGYGYAERDEYERRRGELEAVGSETLGSLGSDNRSDGRT